MDAGFLSVIEIGQHLVMKDTAGLSHFHAVARREYTFKTWRSITTERMDQGNSQIGPVLEGETSYLHG